MDIYNSENEQIDKMRNFFRENGKAIVFGVVLGVGGLLGWRYWQNHQITSASEASLGFETVMSALNQGDANAQAATASFIKANPNSYGAMAALELAKRLVDKGDLASAQKQLEAALQQTKDDNLISLLALRLARLQYAQNQAEAALTTLSQVKANAWAAEAEFIRGNILLAQGKVSDAKQAYLTGINLNPSQLIESQIKLQLKLIEA